MSHVVTVRIYDLGVNVIADISTISLEKQMIRPLGGMRTFTVQSLAGHSLLTTVAGDGYPNLHTGNRKLVVWEDGDPDSDDPIFHGRIYKIERSGDANERLVTITAYDPRAQLGFQADNRAGRVVRGSTVAGEPYDGNFILPKFVSSVDGGPLISGPDLIQQILTNSQHIGGENDPFNLPGEGPLPIDVLSGDWDLLVPPAIDVSPVDSATWPALIGDFINQLQATNVVDFDLKPIRPGTGLDVNSNPSDYIMVEATSKSRIGTDRSGTVHFDYLTGIKNAIAARQVEDFTSVCNKLYDYLGPRLDTSHWRGNITNTTAGVTETGDASADTYGGPGDDKDHMFWIRVFDSLGTESSHRPLYLALYNAEIGYRVNPRTLLYVTPDPDVKALWEPPADYDTYDQIMINTGIEFGVALAEKQRVYGYTKDWTREGVATVSELVTSADGG